MKRKIVIAGSVLGGLLLIGFTVNAVVKRKRKRQDQDFSKFMTALENTIEPEKINQAVINKAFHPDYWDEQVKKNGEDYVIKAEVAKGIAKRISEAWNAGTFWDDLEEEVYRAFEDHRLKKFSDVSRVADEYRKEGVQGKDLWKHLDDKLSTAEFAKVKGIVINKIAA